MKETELLLVRRLLQNEIDRLHYFFVEWFTGTIEDSNSAFTSSVERSMDANFHLVNPQGVMTSREPLLKALKDAYGCRRGQVFRIQCQNLQLLQQHQHQHQECTNSSTSAASSTITTYLVSYEECQQVQESNTARIVSAWFVRVQQQQKDVDNTKNKNKNDGDKDHHHDHDDDILKWKHVHETWMPGMGPPSESHMWTAPKESSK